MHLHQTPAETLSNDNFKTESICSFDSVGLEHDSCEVNLASNFKPKFYIIQRSLQTITFD